jgi:predicted aconitase
MRLNDEERAMLAGELGEPRRWALAHQIQVGEFFDADDFVPVAQAHIMADTESLGQAGVAFLEGLAQSPREQRLVRIPTITDPRGVDFNAYQRLKQTDAMAVIERRAIEAFTAFGVLMTDTCINYQTILPPVKGEHLAMGDTGVVIYSNSVLGARSNFEGGPSALAAGLTGRTPRYGYHVDAHRRGTKLFVVKDRPKDLTGWGALGSLVGRHTNSYWEVPVIDGLEGAPTSDDLKHFGAALASFGSVAQFHMPGITPECTELADVFDGTPPAPQVLDSDDIARFIGEFAATGDAVDVVVFSAPQLSLMEMAKIAELLDGKRIFPKTTMIVSTSPEIKAASDRLGLTQRIEATGAIVVQGICFYQSYAREMAEANGWKRLMSNSAKLVNIISGYGYRPTLASMEHCIDSAIVGRIV